MYIFHSKVALGAFHVCSSLSLSKDLRLCAWDFSARSKATLPSANVLLLSLLLEFKVALHYVYFLLSFPPLALRYHIYLSPLNSLSRRPQKITKNNHVCSISRFLQSSSHSSNGRSLFSEIISSQISCSSLLSTSGLKYQENMSNPQITLL